jgi:hypothetical protein
MYKPLETVSGLWSIFLSPEHFCEGGQSPNAPELATPTGPDRGGGSPLVLASGLVENVLLSIDGEDAVLEGALPVTRG